MAASPCAAAEKKGCGRALGGSDCWEPGAPPAWDERRDGGCTGALGGQGWCGSLAPGGDQPCKRRLQGLRGVRLGETNNPGPGFAAGPAPSRPGEVDWAQYDGFAPGYAGWVLLANPVWDDGRRSFHASPSGGGPSRKFTVAANWGLFDKLDPAGHYLAHGVT